MNKLLHWVVTGIVYAVPLIANSHSPILDMTVSSILAAVYFWASHTLYPTTPLK